MIVLYITAARYPMSKAGGLGGVVGALTKYQKTWVMNNGASFTKITCIICNRLKINAFIIVLFSIFYRG